MNSISEHIKYLNRTFDLARLGTNKVGRNPNVGALLVYNNRIIGEGYHRRFGSIHAEAEAINDAIQSGNQAFISKATLYVSLEPCNIINKTPACTGLISKFGIKTVFAAVTDPNSSMQGKSFEILRQNGIEVITDLEQVKANELIRFFRTTETKKRPYIYLKYAQDKNGYLGNTERQIQISSAETQILTHKLRSEVDAIICGVNTVNLDNPQLNCRAYEGENPLRVIIDPNNRINPKSKVLNDSNPTLHCSYKSHFENSLELNPNSDPIVNQAINHLFEIGLSRVLVEGGAKTHKSFLKENLWDEAIVITSDQALELNIKAPTIEGRLSKTLKIQSDKISYIRSISL